jgi:FG-GAP-like repeat
LDGESGAVQWRASNGSRVWPGVAVADLTGDGSLEIVVGRSGDQLTVYNTSGGVIWTRNPFGSGEIRSLAIADLENDGQIEIVVGRASGGSTQQMSVYEPDGSVRPGWPARRDGEPGYGWGMYNQNVAAGDVNGDGLKEVIGPTDTHYITALDRNGNQLPTNAIFNDFNPKGPKVWSQVGVHVDQAVDLRGYANCGVEHRPNFADSAPFLADVDGNGIREIIVVGNVYNCGTDPYTSLYQMPFIFNGDRSRWSGAGYDWTVIPAPDSAASPLSEDYNFIETVVPNPVTVDLDGNGQLEILFPSFDGRLHAYWLDKSEHGNWPYSVTKPGEGLIRFASEPAVVDLDNNGKAEVIFASWVQKGSYQTGMLHVLNYLGNPLFDAPLPTAVGGDWNGAMAAPTIANIDNDPDLEVVLVTADSGVVAYDLPGTSNARILWNTGRSSFLRSGSK